MHNGANAARQRIAASRAAAEGHDAEVEAGAGAQLKYAGVNQPWAKLRKTAEGRLKAWVDVVPAEKEARLAAVRRILGSLSDLHDETGKSKKKSGRFSLGRFKDDSVSARELAKVAFVVRGALPREAHAPLVQALAAAGHDTVIKCQALSVEDLRALPLPDRTVSQYAAGRFVRALERFDGAPVLDLSDCELSSFPDVGLAFGHVVLRDSKALVALPAGLTVASLDLRGCSALEHVPDLSVAKSLSCLGCVQLRSVDVTDVGGDVNLTGCSALTRLASGLAVGGDLTLSGTPLLSALPAGLRVDGDLTISEDNEVGSKAACISGFPADLHVGQDIYVFACNSLEGLPLGFQARGNLDVSFCGALTALPEGLVVDGALDCSYCRELRQLPEDLAVGSDVRLTGCSALEALPASVAHVRGDLELDYCNALHELPDGLVVDGDLDCSGCVALEALPEALVVGGDVDLEGTSALLALPDRMLDWPLQSWGYGPHNVYLSNSGLPDGELERLRALEGHNLKFHVSLRYGNFEHAAGFGNAAGSLTSTTFESLSDAVSFWTTIAVGDPPPDDKKDKGEDTGAGEGDEEDGEEAQAQAQAQAQGQERVEGESEERREGQAAAGADAEAEAETEIDAEAEGESGAPEAAAGTVGAEAEEEAKYFDLEPLISPDNVRGVLLFLTKLRGAKEFRAPELQLGLAKRVVEVLEVLVEDPLARDEIVARMVDSIDACHDKPVWALNQLTLYAKVAHARQGPEEGLRRLGLGVMRLGIVHEHVERKIRSLSFVDDVCVYLRFEIALREDLELPVSALSMLFSQYITVTAEEIDAARTEALAVTDEAFEQWLQHWPEWERFQRERFAEELSFSDLKRNSRRFSLSWTDIFGNSMARPVRVGGAVWELDDLMRHWRATGLDLNNSPRSIEEMRKLTRCKSVRLTSGSVASEDDAKSTSSSSSKSRIKSKSKSKSKRKSKRGSKAARRSLAGGLDNIEEEDGEDDGAAAT